MLPSTPPSTGEYTFYATPLETVYVVDEDAKTAYQATSPWYSHKIVVMPPYNVSWKVNGEPYAIGNPSTSVKGGQSVTVLPTEPDAIGTKVFVGWTDAEIAATQSTAPDVLFTTPEDAPAVTGNVTYYAVFADATGSDYCTTFPDVQLSVGATGYATLYYSNYDLVVPENTVAYTYRSENGALTESETYAEGTVIPAGEAVVVHTTNDVPCTLNFKKGFATVDCDANSQLAGTDEETVIAPDADYYFYGLSLNSSNDINSVGFYWMVADGAAFTNGAHKAYLKIKKSEFASTQPVRGFAFKGTTTGVESVESSNNAPQAIYDLTGRRVSKTEKGIYIINGKKVIK